MKDFYQILGVPETANDDEIKKAYRKLAKRYHPDTNPGNKQAENKFKEISGAYDVLSDRQKRSQYDQMRKYGAGGLGDYGGFGRGGARPRAGTEGGVDFEDLSSIFGEFGGFGSFADIFSSLFGDRPGAGMPGARGRRAAQGEDLYSEVDVPFKTAATGGRMTVRVNVSEQCSVCRGTGAKSGSAPKTCPECQGRGTISFVQGNFAVSRPCPKCLGRGQIVTEVCPTCAGRGTVRRPREIAVTIPAGIENGKNIRLKGLGNPGTNGGPPGDLYLQVNITQHQFFWREGLDIYCRVPINIAQAVHGTKIRVRTITDKKVELKVPPGTRTGARFRMRGFGLTQNGRKGDQIVEIEIKIPQKMTDEEKKMLEEMGDKIGLKK
ncbi:MAG: molecular chaperone DnaJ [candidate division Zixibacteria bacterium RBG_16_53_22]|nr:MAG: molecular chaperone DnaJ [candidate division Zixibacteria bacterium RBG_16_53_22]